MRAIGDSFGLSSAQLLRQVRIQSRWHGSNNMFEQYSDKHAMMPARFGWRPVCFGQHPSAAEIGLYIPWQALFD